jgi:imidazole glycerol-phosphate synthase subunit HisH
MITILHYGLGNILSIRNMLRKAGYDSIVASTYAEFKSSTKIILPGVGHFDYGMKKLRSAPFFNSFLEKVTVKNIPILGICLGAQMLLEGSDEGKESGLGFIDGRCSKFEIKKMDQPHVVPNMVWSDIKFVKETGLNNNLIDNPRYYFVHSYHINCKHDADVLATADYGYTFTAAIQKENIFGVQFHPEKSHRFGMELLRNFARL